MVCDCGTCKNCKRRTWYYSPNGKAAIQRILQRYRDRPPREEHKCPKCNIVKPTSGFHRSASSPTGLATYCKLCSITTPEQKLAIRHSSLRRKYGITLAKYEELRASQEGLCGICKQAPTDKALVVDHNHQTGKVRGLLCDPCNRALGVFRDDPDLLEAARLYLLDNM